MVKLLTMLLCLAALSMPSWAQHSELTVVSPTNGGSYVGNEVEVKASATGNPKKLVVWVDSQKAATYLATSIDYQQWLAFGVHRVIVQAIWNSKTSISSAPINITVSAPIAPIVNCTLYASATGSDTNAGTVPTSPKTFTGAAQAAMPGAVVCLKAGTYSRSTSFTPPRSGTATSWITYRSYGDGPVNLVWTGDNTASSSLVNLSYTTGSFPDGFAYLEFRGLNLDGQNTARRGFFCQNGHHLRFIDNSVRNTGGPGIASVNCDYLTADHNLVYHNGYVQGWTSAISYNGVPWYDSYTGFHNIIANNIISGEYDNSTNHSDGNGIILDLSADRIAGITHANTPAALIVNNVVYQNGGRCIHAYTVTNAWIVNNTCYKNDLDILISSGNAGQIGSNASHDVSFINNISYSWKSNNPAYYSQSGSYNVNWYKNLYYGGGLNFTPSDPVQFFNSDPLFINPPYVDPRATGQYATALDPAELGTGLGLQFISPAMNKGIDPAALANIPANIVTDLKKWIYKDIAGNSRPPGEPFDLGAYAGQ